MSKYIKELQLKNFQSHEDTTLTFDPHFNIITGDNGVGKTAVFRAMGFLAYNRPIKNIERSFLRKKKNSLIIKATMDDGSWVLREKGAGVSRYLVWDEAIQKEHGGYLELNNFGNEVPAEVGRILGMALIQVSKTQEIAVNMASQNEPSFMISRSSPEIARWVYSLTNLDIARYCIDDINRDVKRNNDRIKDHNSRINQLNDKLKNFEGLDVKELKLSQLEQNNIDIEEWIANVGVLDDIWDTMMSLKEKAIPTKKRIEQLNQKIMQFSDDSIDEDLVKLKQLIVLSENTNNITGKINKLNKEIDKFDNISNVNIDEILEDINTLRSLLDLYNRIMSNHSTITQLTSDIEHSTKSLEKCEKQILEITNQLFGSSDTPKCPVCGCEVDSSLMEHIIEELDYGKHH